MKLKTFIGEFLYTINPKDIYVIVPMDFNTGAPHSWKMNLEYLQRTEFGSTLKNDSIFQRNVIKLEYVNESYYIYVEPKNVIKVDKDLDTDVRK